MDITRRTALRAAAVTGTTAGLSLAIPETALAAYPMLRRGSRGSAVVTLQRRLARLRYWTGPIDGILGHLTEQAVYAIQKAARIARDGIVGPITWGRLWDGVRPGVRTNSGTWVEIHKSRQLLKLVVGGSLRMTLNTSTGSGDRYYSGGRWHTASTPSGSYRVFRRVNGMDYGPLGSLWRPAYFNGGIAIHGYTSVPPWPASHGCVRVSNSAMNKLWRDGRVPVGRRVLVY